MLAESALVGRAALMGRWRAGRGAEGFVLRRSSKFLSSWQSACKSAASPDRQGTAGTNTDGRVIACVRGDWPKSSKLKTGSLCCSSSSSRLVLSPDMLHLSSSTALHLGQFWPRVHATSHADCCPD